MLILHVTITCKQGFPGGSDHKESACNVETQVCSLGGECPLEKRMATHFSIHAWRIPWTVASDLGVTELDTTE